MKPFKRTYYYYTYTPDIYVGGNTYWANADGRNKHKGESFGLNWN